MGWWGTGIMEGDSPCDVADRFKAKFLSEPGWSAPSAEACLQLMDEIHGDWGCDHEAVVLSVGFQTMQIGGPFNDKLRKTILDSIAIELSDDQLECWTDPAERRQKLEEFKAVVEIYPDEGAKCEMPTQDGLFDKLAEFFVKNS